MEDKPGFAPLPNRSIMKERMQYGHRRLCWIRRQRPGIPPSLCGKPEGYEGQVCLPPGRGYCPVCLEKQEEDLKKVKEYMWDNKGATVQELSENCNVDAKLIMQWLRKERIQLASESGIELFCETCGNKILTGRYCDKCKLDTQNRLT